MTTMTKTTDATIEQRLAYECGPAIVGWFNVLLNGKFIGCVYTVGENVWRTNANHQRHATFRTQDVAIAELFRQKGIA